MPDFAARASIAAFAGGDAVAAVEQQRCPAFDDLTANLEVL